MNIEKDLIQRARARAEMGIGSEWGSRIDRLETSGDFFVGRFRGEAEDESYQGYSHRVWLFWDADGQPVWCRGKWALNKEFDRAQPKIGDTIVIYTGEAWEGKGGNTGFYYGVETEPCPDPLPTDDAVVRVGGGGQDLDIPFMPTV
jgi:hypothetical protein